MSSRFRPLNGPDCRAQRRNGIRSQIWRRSQTGHWRHDGVWHHHLLQHFVHSGQVHHNPTDANPGYVRLADRYKQMLCYVICLFILCYAIMHNIQAYVLTAVTFYTCVQENCKFLRDEMWVNLFTAITGNFKNAVKGKAIPLQAWTGPEGSRRLRLPDFISS